MDHSIYSKQFKWFYLNLNICQCIINCPHLICISCKLRPLYNHGTMTSSRMWLLHSLLQVSLCSFIICPLPHCLPQPPKHTLTCFLSQSVSSHFLKHRITQDVLFFGLVSFSHILILRVIYVVKCISSLFSFVTE